MAQPVQREGHARERFPMRTKRMNMNTKQNLCLLGAFAALVVAASAFAQGSGNGTNVCTGTNDYYYNHSYSYSNHWFFTNSGPWYSDLSRWTNTSPPRAWTNHNRVVGPGKALGQGGAPTPAAVQDLVRQFQQDRENYMTQRRSLEQQMASASEQQRQQIRDQLRDQLDQWKRQQARVREQLKDQAERLREQLRDHARLMDQVSNPGTSTGGSGQPAGPRGR
jgi:gas vesicle protein